MVDRDSSTSPRRLTAALAASQLVSWGVLFYAFAVAAPELDGTEGWSTSQTTGALSVGLFTSGLAAPAIARALNRWGPRATMTSGSVAGAVGMTAWAITPSLPGLYAAWVLIGVAMAATLYEPALATLVSFHRERARQAIVAVTVAGGLASTVFAPVTEALIERWGWRVAVAVLGVAGGAVTAGLHRVALPATRARSGIETARARAAWSKPLRRLAVAQVLEQLGSVAATALLVAFLLSRGLSPATAAGALAATGVGKLLGRMVLAALSRARSTRLAAAAAAGQAAALATLAFTSDVSAIFAATAMAGAAAGWITVLRPLITMEFVSAGGFPSTSASLYRAAVGGRAAGPFLLGAAVDTAGWLTGWFVAVGCLAAAAVVFHRIDTMVAVPARQWA